MIKDFNDNIVLTTQDPGGFLNFRWENGDPNLYIIPDKNPNISIRTLWVNGIDISGDASIYETSIGYAVKLGSTGDPSIASLFLYTRELSDFSYNLHINIYSDSGLSMLYYSFDVSVLNRPYIVTSNDINVNESSNIQADGDTSYLILRTNPKFTGNIKLTVDSSDNLYLDTFKVSDILSNKKYRKQIVSSNSVFSGDVRNVFSTLPLGEMYRLDAEDTLNISLPKTDIYKQFNLNYSYGARLFEDELYDDDYAILAPLWINNTLPDYFAIFRVDGVYNPETYANSSLSDLASKFFQEGDLIKSWGIKEKTPVGTYLRNHLNELSNVVAPLFLSLSDPNQKDPDPNTWYGVAVDKGIIAGRSETTYFFDQKSSNFTDMNAFVSGGFERLNLLCPNLINIDYSFNDDDVSLYTMHRYYGLYLTENPLYEISYYSPNPGSDIQILSLDGKDSSEFFSSVIFDASGDISSSYSNRIFTLDDLLKIKRITNVNQINGSIKSEINEWLNKPNQNIFTTDVTKINGLGSFFSIDINRLLSQGEHLRIVDKTANKIWEIYGLSSDILGAGEAWNYATKYSSVGYPDLYRSAFSIKGTISDQIQAIKKAWDVFEDYEHGAPFTTYLTGSNSLSFKYSDLFVGDDLYFQRITAQTLLNISDPSSSFNTTAKCDDLGLYGVFNPTIDNFERISFDSSFGPINFELYGDRMSMMMKIFDSTPYHVYSFDSSIVDKFNDNILYLGQDQWYRLVQNFVLTTQSVSSTFQYVKDPTALNNNKVIIITEQPIVTINGKWNAYSVYPLVISLMGINPVKDFDYTVYDSSLGFKSNYWYNREGDASTWEINLGVGESKTISSRGSYEIIGGTGSLTIAGTTVPFSGPLGFNTFDACVGISAFSPTRINYTSLDGSASFRSYDSSLSEESLSSYYRTPNVLLKYGLTVPYVTKWVSIGNDARNNPLRLILDSSLFDVSTNFIPYGNNFSSEISYPNFKYLSPGIRNWEDYIFFDINDSIQYNIDLSTYYTTFKELMISQPSLDVFSKLIYSNKDVPGTKLRSSIVYYNNYKDSVDGIINGLNLSFTLEPNAKSSLNIQDWNRYRISLISIPSRNRDNNKPMEVFINENNQTILMVWYQGNDVLNYSKRNSSFLQGKNILSSGMNINFESFISGNPIYSHVKTPFGVNNSTLATTIFNIYGIDTTYDSSLCSPFLQSNINVNDAIYSVFNAYSGNTVLPGGSFAFSKSYNTFKGYVDYVYSKNAATFGNGVINFPYTYINNTNFYSTQTCDLSTFQNIITTNNIYYYIFKEGNSLNSDSFGVNPIIISINAPRTYKGVITYNGWYKPNFNNILDFNFNEKKELIDIIGKDFILGNTDLKSYSNISQFWYNKVVSAMNTYDFALQNAINYLNSFNVFKSQWDSKYYKITFGGVTTDLDGYNSSLELPSFFGSKLVNLPKTLILDTWNSNLTTTSSTRDILTLNYNLTKSITSLFKNQTTFTQNWNGLTNSDKILNDYIKNTIVNYYNISKTKIKIEIWIKPVKGTKETKLAYTLTSDFQKWDAANVDGALLYLNNEYIYRIKVATTPFQQYYVRFTLFEK
jgi:hypothetical protein